MGKVYMRDGTILLLIPVAERMYAWSDFYCEWVPIPWDSIESIDGDKVDYSQICELV